MPLSEAKQQAVRELRKLVLGIPDDHMPLSSMRELAGRINEQLIRAVPLARYQHGSNGLLKISLDVSVEEANAWLMFRFVTYRLITDSETFEWGIASQHVKCIVGHMERSLATLTALV